MESTLNHALTRRNFCTAAGAGAAAAATAALATSLQTAAASQTDAAAIEWADAADIVVIGSGASGCSTASWYLLNNPGGSVIILEVAPEGQDGGNSRVSGNSIIFADDPASLAAYKKGLDFPFDVDDEIVDVWAEYMWNGNEILNDIYGTSITSTGGAGWGQLAGAEAIHQGPGGKNENGFTTWELIKAKAVEVGAKFYYETRAAELLTDAQGQVVGVRAEDGRCFKGTKATVLACGSMEFDPQMRDTYRPAGQDAAVGRGSWFNRGDGIRMAQALGADLWHMNNFTGSCFALLGESREQRNMTVALNTPAIPDFIFVSNEGKRFRYEENGGARGLGKQLIGSRWYEVDIPTSSYMIFGQKAYDAKAICGSAYWAAKVGLFTVPASNDEYVAKGLAVKCENVEELAAAFDLPVDTLRETLDTYNANAAQNIDPVFNRGKAITTEGTVEVGLHVRSGRASSIMTKPFDLTPLEFPLYITELVPAFLLSFGGPRRGAHGEVIHVSGQPIPRLYSTGECGSTQASKYQAGAAFAEAISSGRLAADTIAALEPWE